MEDKILKKAESLNVDYCDVRKVRTSGLALEVKDGELKKAISGDETGLCIRVLKSGAWGFSATSDLTWRQVKKTLEVAVNLAKTSSRHLDDKVELKPTKVLKITEDWKPKVHPADVPIEEKFDLISSMDNRIHEFENILTVTTGYSERTQEMHYQSSEDNGYTHDCPGIINCTNNYKYRGFSNSNRRNYGL